MAGGTVEATRQGIEVAMYAAVIRAGVSADGARQAYAAAPVTSGAPGRTALVASDRTPEAVR